MNVIDELVLEEVPSFYHRYLKAVPETELLPALQHASNVLWAVINDLPSDRHEYRYAEDKWSVKDVLQHIVDGERIFSYRALRFARNDSTPLPGFEENDYAPEARTHQRGLHAIMREHDAVRQATIELFKSFDDLALQRSGMANDTRISVRGLGWVIAGHAQHHARILRERYLI
jgi:uncharacterized damage-inducible protein DinB